MPIKFTRPAELAFGERFRQRIFNVYSYFPELREKEIICGAISRRGAVQGVATCWTDPPLFRLLPGASMFTIAHELTHIVQGGESEIPHGEIACDIWTIDRMPLQYLDQIPYYLLSGIRIDWDENREAVKELCKQAIAFRTLRRTYITWLRCRIKEL
jgi:hypothetical protein